MNVKILKLLEKKLAKQNAKNQAEVVEEETKTEDAE